MDRAAIMVLLLLGSACAAACSRPGHVPPWPVQLESYYRDHAHIFVGRFDSIQVVTVKETDWPGESRKRATFAVIEVIKGNPGSLPFLDTGFGGGDCAPAISGTEPYIIMADSKGIVYKAWAIAYPAISDKDRSDLKALQRMAAAARNRQLRSMQKSNSTDATR
jgi:hypothetical protein